jgi:hypothetical protein
MGCPKEVDFLSCAFVHGAVRQEDSHTNSWAALHRTLGTFMLNSCALRLPKLPLVLIWPHVTEQVEVML